MTKRPVLYFMVAAIGIYSAITSISIKWQLNRLESKLNQSPTLFQEVNGTSTNQFYQIAGTRAYTMIDNKPVVGGRQ